MAETSPAEAEGMRDMIRTYQDFNSDVVDELSSEPSPLEFMRYVSRNRPFVVRQAAQDWPAVRLWSASYLTQALHDKRVQVTITPNGADAPHQADDGAWCFAKPVEQTLPFADAMARICDSTAAEAWYAQTQNDNLRGEYEALFDDVAKDVAWARIALQLQPDAINMWIGSDKSTTVLHRDPYQNIYVQVAGAKRFTLVPPAEMACVNEHMVPSASWTLQPDLPEQHAGKWKLVRDESADDVPCALWDPDKPAENGNAFSDLCRPLRVMLNAGDLLYLPALWYHKVQQINGPEGFCSSINYWYDMDFSGWFYAFDRFLRQSTLRKH